MKIEEIIEEKKQIHSEDPYVCTYDNILSEDDCQHFINISKHNLKKALVSTDKKGVESRGRSGLNTWIDHNHDPITTRVAMKISSIVKLPIENAEKYQVIYYGENQEYRNHYDSWQHNYSEKTLRCMKYGGARLVTALCYLNDVEEGGGTKMTKKNITIQAKKGRLLIFHNTYPKTNIRHELSEHAGMPVIRGEKYAFNLWFKECNSKMLYSVFNPSYYNISSNQNIQPKLENKIKDMSNNEIQKLHNNKEIFFYNNVIKEEYISILTSNLSFNNDSKRRSAWVKLDKVNNFIHFLEQKLNITKNFFENINIIEYKKGHHHGRHYNAYDLNTEKGKQYTEQLGQRIYTITLFLTNNIKINFNQLNVNKIFEKGDILIYKNIIDQDNVNRDLELERIIENTGNVDGYIANIYVREKDNNGNIHEITELFNTSQTKLETPINLQSENIIKEKQIENENYSLTLEIVLDKFEKNLIFSNWNQYKSFKYCFKGNFDSFKKYVLDYKKIKENTGCLNKVNLNQTYSLNEDLPLQIVNNVLTPEYLNLLQKYYKENIQNNVWPLGDKQSNRYKAHNEAFSRFLHYEILPLIEKITNKKLCPTYTYLSCYVKGADLPGHTDRQDCEYTVSFIIDKPKDTTWNIYLHKIKQPIKYKGRYPNNPPKEECIPVDCDSGGLMIFQGTDHIHFREKLDFDYYNILLLHFCSI